MLSQYQNIQLQTGPYDIHYQMLKHLPETALDILLHIFNGIWTTGVFPESWRLATIIPIPKPGPLGIKLSALPRPWGLNSHWERC